MGPSRSERSLPRGGPRRATPARGRARTAARCASLRRALPWTRVAHRRRCLLALLVLVPSVIASGFMVNVLPHQGGTSLEVAIVALLRRALRLDLDRLLDGAVRLLHAGARPRPLRDHQPADGDPAKPARRIDAGAGRTAIVMPICDEPVERVFAGLRAIHRSLERAGARRPLRLLRPERHARPGHRRRARRRRGSTWCREVDGFGRIFYRRRHVRASSARAATSPTSAAAGARATAT